MIYILMVVVGLFFALAGKRSFAAEGDSQILTHVVQTMSAEGGQRSKITFLEGATVTKIKTFMALYSDAAILGVTKCDKLECAAVAAGAGANVDVKLKITYKNTTTGKYGKFVIPAPVDTLTYDPSDKGERLSASDGAAIVAAYVTANTITDTLVFTRGVKIQTA